MSLRENTGIRYVYFPIFADTWPFLYIYVYEHGPFFLTKYAIYMAISMFDIYRCRTCLEMYAFLQPHTQQYFFSGGIRAPNRKMFLL
jgi:hypothetical protein